jgi:threonine dehydratase
MISYNWLEQAADRISPYIHQTPLTYDPQENLYLKWENQQVTGSFKIRGALNKVLSLETSERERGLVTASAGNHGQGVALAGKIVGAPVIVFASDHAVPAKLEAMRLLGAELRLVPGGYGEAEQAGLEYASASGATWISPYNDAQVIAGQGTLGLEILQQLRESSGAQPEAWIVPGGGGGLISGVGAALKSRPNPLGPHSLKGEKDQPVSILIGVQSEASPFLYAIFHTGTQAGSVELPSLADGLAGPVEENSLTIPLTRKYVNDFVLVNEEDIAHAIAFAWKQYGERIEGSSAAALSAALTGKVTSRPAVIVLSGGNIQPELHEKIVTGEK